MVLEIIKNENLKNISFKSLVEFHCDGTVVLNSKIKNVDNFNFKKKVCFIEVKIQEKGQGKEHFYYTFITPFNIFGKFTSIFFPSKISEKIIIKCDSISIPMCEVFDLLDVSITTITKNKSINEYDTKILDLGSVIRKNTKLHIIDTESESQLRRLKENRSRYVAQLKFDNIVNKINITITHHVL